MQLCWTLFWIWNFSGMKPRLFFLLSCDALALLILSRFISCYVLVLEIHEKQGVNMINIGE